MYVMGVFDEKGAAKSIWLQIVEFIGFSGIGWLIDFSFYLGLSALGLPVGVANYLSAIPGVTFVFCFATKKTFVVNTGGLSLRTKYILYLIYQLLLVAAVSLLNQLLFDWIRSAVLPESLLYRFAAVISKVLITPVTMTINFLVLKRLTERM